MADDYDVVANYEKFANGITDGKYSNFTAEEKLHFIFDVEEGLNFYVCNKTIQFIAEHFDDDAIRKQHPLYRYVKVLIEEALSA